MVSWPIVCSFSSTTMRNGQKLYEKKSVEGSSVDVMALHAPYMTILAASLQYYKNGVGYLMQLNCSLVATSMSNLSLYDANGGRYSASNVTPLADYAYDEVPWLETLARMREPLSFAPCKRPPRHLSILVSCEILATLSLRLCKWPCTPSIFLFFEKLSLH